MIVRSRHPERIICGWNGSGSVARRPLHPQIDLENAWEACQYSRIKDRIQDGPSNRESS